MACTYNYNFDPCLNPHLFLTSLPSPVNHHQPDSKSDTQEVDSDHQEVDFVSGFKTESNISDRLSENCADSEEIESFHPPSSSSNQRCTCFTYVQLITQAITSSPNKQLSTRGIYDYITKTYPQYKMEDTIWQVSVLIPEVSYSSSSSHHPNSSFFL